MPRPQTKALLLAEGQQERAALENFIATLSPAQMTQPGILGDWSVKDTLAHLVEWEQMLLGWLAASQRNETPAVPATGYKWSQLPALNEQIRQKYQPRSLDEVLSMFRDSYQQITATMDALSEDLLFTPGLYAWMNKNTLAAYFTSATSSHYRWARKEIRKGLRVKS